LPVRWHVKVNAQFDAVVTQQVFERLGLGQRARKAVEQRAVLGVRLFEAVLDQLDHQVIETVRPSQESTRRNGRAAYRPGWPRRMSPVETCGLRTGPRGGGTAFPCLRPVFQNDEIQTIGHRYFFRKPS